MLVNPLKCKDQNKIKTKKAEPEAVKRQNSHILNIIALKCLRNTNRSVGWLVGRSNHNQSWRMSRLTRYTYAHTLPLCVRSKSVSHKNNPLVISYFRFDSISIWYAFELQLIAHIPKYRHCGTSLSFWALAVSMKTLDTIHILVSIFFSAFTRLLCRLINRLQSKVYKEMVQMYQQMCTCVWVWVWVWCRIFISLWNCLSMSYSMIGECVRKKGTKKAFFT